jgi:hypothetical protein
MAGWKLNLKPVDPKKKKKRKKDGQDDDDDDDDLKLHILLSLPI